MANLTHLRMLSARVFLDNWCPARLLKYKQRIEASPLGYRLLRGAFWSFAGSLISRGLGLLSSILVARILGKNGFGRLGMVQSTVGMFAMLAGFGMGLTAIKHVAEFRFSDPARAGRIIAMSSLFSWVSSGVMGTVLFVLAPWLATHSLADPEMSPLLKIGALLLLLGGVNGAQTGVLSGFEAFKMVAGINLTTGLLTFPITLISALKWGVLGATWGLVASLAMSCLLTFIAVRRECRRCQISTPYRRCWQELPILCKYSLPAVLASALSGPVNWLVSTILVNQPGGYGEMGVYNAVLRIKLVPDQVLTILLTPLLPVLSETLSRRDTNAYKKTALAAFSLSLVVTAPFALLQVAFPGLTLLPYGPVYAGQNSTVQWVMADLAFIGFFTPMASIIYSMGRMWFGLAYQLFLNAIYYSLGLSLIPKYGGAGFAAAICISRGLMVAPSLLYMFRYERDLLCGLPLIRIAFALLVSVTVCFLAGHWGYLWLPVAGFCVAMLPLLFAKELLLNGGLRNKALSQPAASTVSL